MSLAVLRHQDHYKAAVRELRDAGLSWREELGGKHARIIVTVNGREEVETLSLSPSDWRTTKEVRARFRRRIRQWKAEAVASVVTETAPALFPTLEKETMDDSTSLSGSAIELIAPTEGMIGEAVLQTVNARDLHAYLGVGKVFGAWITNRISSYDFIEHVDFEVFSETGNNPTGGRPSKEYAISLDMAKELAMVERTPKGREARRYFIECERVAHEGPRTELAAPPADADAILALMADMFAGIVKSQQSGHATALDHIDNTKAATLHYMKANLKEPAQAFYDDARARNKAAYQRDQIMLEAMRALTAEASKLNRAARQTMLERPFVWDDWYDLSRIYSEFYADQVIHRRRFLSNQISRSLDSWCKRHRRHIDMDSREVGGRYVNFYHRDAVIAWLDGGGRAIIDAHLRQGARQASLHLVGGGRS